MVLSKVSIECPHCWSDDVEHRQYAYLCKRCGKSFEVVYK